MKSNASPIGTRSGKRKKNAAKSEISGVCGWLMEEEDPDLKEARFDVLSRLPGVSKHHICGAAISEKQFVPQVPYNLPEGSKLVHSTCLCEKHYRIFNRAFEKRFFNFEHSGPTSSESSLSTSPEKVSFFTIFLH